MAPNPEFTYTWLLWLACKVGRMTSWAAVSTTCRRTGASRRSHALMLSTGVVVPRRSWLQ